MRGTAAARDTATGRDRRDEEPPGASGPENTRSGDGCGGAAANRAGAPDPGPECLPRRGAGVPAAHGPAARAAGQSVSSSSDFAAPDSFGATIGSDSCSASHARVAVPR